MSELSKNIGLSRIYTNHSIRATGITVLTNAKYSNADIMSISGHKSIQSLAVYQRTDTNQKIKMGKTLSGSLQAEYQHALPRTEQLKALPVPKSQMQIALKETENATTIKEWPEENETPAIALDANLHDDEEMPDIDLLKAICDIEENQNEVTKPTKCSTTVANTQNVYNQVPKSFFANCQIGTINVNFVTK